MISEIAQVKPRHFDADRLAASTEFFFERLPKSITLTLTTLLQVWSRGFRTPRAPITACSMTATATFTSNAKTPV